MTRQIIISIFCSISILLSTFHVYGFVDVEKGAVCCCGPKVSSQSSCCESPDDKSEEKPCGNKCEHHGCKCMTPALTVFVFKEPVVIEQEIETTYKKLFLIENETFLSCDFSTIWAPPKIS